MDLFDLVCSFFDRKSATTYSVPRGLAVVDYSSIDHREKMDKKIHYENLWRHLASLLFSLLSLSLTLSLLLSLCSSLPSPPLSSPLLSSPLLSSPLSWWRMMDPSAPLEQETLETPQDAIDAGNVNLSQPSWTPDSGSKLCETCSALFTLTKRFAVLLVIDGKQKKTTRL